MGAAVAAGVFAETAQASTLQTEKVGSTNMIADAHGPHLRDEPSPCGLNKSGTVVAWLRSSESAGTSNRGVRPAAPVGLSFFVESLTKSNDKSIAPFLKAALCRGALRAFEALVQSM